MKKNCWDAKACGFTPEDCEKLFPKTCPASTDPFYDGLNSGHNGGRICWAVADTFCRSTINSDNDFIDKARMCALCSFMRLVRQEEGRSFILLPQEKPERYPHP